MFNVRIKQFYDTEQVQIFEKIYHSKGEVIKAKVDEETGEILPREKSGSFLYNPFEEDFGRYDHFGMDDDEKRAESIRISTNRTVKTVYDIARSNVWDWFVTFTFNPAKVDRYDYEACTKKLSNWLKNMGRVCPDLKYLIVPEHHKDGAWHFHGLFSNCAGMDFVPSGHFDRHGRTIYNVGKYRFGWTTATIVSNNHCVTSYLCKYVTKELCSLTMGKKRYWVTRNVSRPEVFEYVAHGSLDEILYKFIEPDSHISMTESPYGSCIYLDHVMR